MADVFKFPNGGYDVEVCRKQDILDCIDDNIIDKELALLLVEYCERTAADFIEQGRWTGIPFMGNIRLPEGLVIEEKRNQKELVSEARETLSHEQYAMFRKQLITDNGKYIKNQRYFNYITSQAVNKNRKLFNKLCDTQGENYAKVFLFASRHLTLVSDDIEDDE